ncbi:MAG: membrane-bound O-acyltransferase family protein [Deltaproteobacteria bacterium]|nr:membrane-bound O-acyltransferase family protein [Deltaproteobacteria bacterium]
MVFSAPTFLFLFLPVVLSVVLIAPRALRNTLLLAASLFFYAWGETGFVVVMIGSIVFNYLAGLGIGRFGGAGRTWMSPLLLALAVAGNLALLGWFKYAGFLAENLSVLLASLGLGEGSFSQAPADSIHLPIGISFFTFQAISYLIDIHRGEHPPQRNPIRLALFISLFPQLIAGPIVRYKDLVDQLASRAIDVEAVAAGIRRFTVGLSKKLLIANSLGVPADAIFALPAGELGPSVAWFGLLCYSLQIYFDFSGYSDMAIGLGRLFGFRLPENFDQPYRAASLTEFWRRWHISLSSWFRDYLYIPLGGNRHGSRRTYVNLLIVFLLCGLWHGASWNFIVWGLLHGTFLTIERAGLRGVLEQISRPIAHGYCLFVVGLAWVFFRAESLPHAIDFGASLFGLGIAEAAEAKLIVDFASVEALVVCAVGICWAAGLLQRLVEGLSRVARVGESISSAGRSLLYAWLPTSGMLALWFLCAMKLASRTYDPFLYFRF